MAGRLTLACVQTSSGNDMEANIAAAAALVHRADAAGADLLALPEVVGLIETDPAALRAHSPGEAEHPVRAAFSDLARTLGKWILVGSMTVGLDSGKFANRSLLLDGRGRTAARYDKIPLFDADLPDGQRFRESERYQAGTRARIADTPWGRLGMTICYDLRFPALYWDLARAGAHMLSVPSAFTARTGRDHWHVLLRARAIETGCYVIAPAQCGSHGGGRRSYGHSLVVDPWGTVVADGGEAPGIVLAEIDPGRIAEARAALPTLANRRSYDGPWSRAAAE